MSSKDLSKLRKKYLKRLKGYLSKSEVRRIKVQMEKLGIMPKDKIKHSIRVSDRLVDFDVDKDVILGALFHDYIERGGDVDSLDLSEDTKDIIRFLSSFDDKFSDSDNEPLEHLIHVFGRIQNQGLKNKLVLIKVSDRIDNLNRRGKSVSKKYLNKSIDLLRFLMANYTGSVDLGELLMALNRKLKKKFMKKVRITEGQYIDGVSFKDTGEYQSILGSNFKIYSVQHSFLSDEDDVFVLINNDIRNEFHFPKGIPEELRGKGLGSSIIKAAIDYFGYISTNSRDMSPEFRLVVNRLIEVGQPYIDIMGKMYLVSSKDLQMHLNDIYSTYDSSYLKSLKSMIKTNISSTDFFNESVGMKVRITEGQYNYIMEEETVSIESFYQKHGIDSEELSWLGSGDFGDAYSTEDGRVVKFTSSKSEFDIAKKLVGKSDKFDGFAAIYDAVITDKGKVILMEELEVDSEIEDLWYQVSDLLGQQGLPPQYIHYFDTEEYEQVNGEIDQSVLDFIDGIDNINRSYRMLGIEASDIRPENMGYDSDGNLKAFDIDDKAR